MLGFLKRRKSSPGQQQRGVSADLGILVFANTTEVIVAERALKQAGWAVRVMGPPPSIQTGCDLVLEFPLLEELNILRQLDAAKIPPLQVVPVTAPLLEPISLLQTKDFGAYLMVRAANMKITIAKSDRRIVNISGGGCPDVPYLAREMIGKTVDEAPRPRALGHTLCGYALELAHAELRRR
ncbi:MAG: DUF3343 domain-containing protein [Desulfopila sp.]